MNNSDLDAIWFVLDPFFHKEQDRLLTCDDIILKCKTKDDFNRLNKLQTGSDWKFVRGAFSSEAEAIECAEYIVEKSNTFKQYHESKFNQITNSLNKTDKHKLIGSGAMLVQLSSRVAIVDVVTITKITDKYIHCVYTNTGFPVKVKLMSLNPKIVRDFDYASHATVLMTDDQIDRLLPLMLDFINVCGVREKHALTSTINEIDARILSNQIHLQNACRSVMNKEHSNDGRGTHD